MRIIRDRIKLFSLNSFYFLKKWIISHAAYVYKLYLLQWLGLLVRIG